MKLKIPCESCGCQHCDATTKSGESVHLQICRCEDGSSQFDIMITDENGNTINETHQCNEKDVEDCLNSRFNIDLESMSHECFEE